MTTAVRLGDDARKLVPDVDLDALAPAAAFEAIARAGHLGFQVDPDGNPVFYPRVVAPGSGAALTWRTSAGRGTIYASTVVHIRGEEPQSLVLVDLDEGFRMMSSVRGIEPAEVTVGMPVQVRIDPVSGDDRPVPVFEPRGPKEGS